jgi:hypothetical protein
MKVRLRGVTGVAALGKLLPCFDEFSDSCIYRPRTKVCQQNVRSRFCELQDYVVAQHRVESGAKSRPLR